MSACCTASPVFRYHGRNEWSMFITSDAGSLTQCQSTATCLKRLRLTNKIVRLTYFLTAVARQFFDGDCDLVDFKWTDQWAPRKGEEGFKAPPLTKSCIRH